MLKKPGLEDSDTAETDDVEKVKKAGDTTPEKASEEATTKLMAEKDLELVVTEALKKVDFNLSL